MLHTVTFVCCRFCKREAQRVIDARSTTACAKLDGRPVCSPWRNLGQRPKGIGNDQAWPASQEKGTSKTLHQPTKLVCEPHGKNVSINPSRAGMFTCSTWTVSHSHEAVGSVPMGEDSFRHRSLVFRKCTATTTATGSSRLLLLL